jgi:hypothetical protein
MNIAWIPGLTPGMTEVCGGMVEEKKSTWEERIKSETLWLWIALGVAGAAIIGTLAAIPFVTYPAGDNEKVKVHIEIAKLFGTALIAALTFSTVIWRGLVGARQANEQKRANDAKDEENTARLLVDGAKLLADDKITYVAAGMTALEMAMEASIQTARASSKTLVISAMNVFADYIIDNINSKAHAKTVERARVAMTRMDEFGYQAERTLYIKGSDALKSTSIFAGFQFVIYRDVEITRHQTIAIDVSKTSIENCTLKLTKLAQIDEETLCFNVFRFVDFSSVNVISKGMGFTPETDPATFKHCFYYRDSPPTGDGAHLILPYLAVRDRPAT